jgi:prefoldin subunit 5
MNNMNKLIEFLQFRVDALEKKNKELEDTIKQKDEYILTEIKKTI